MIRRCGSAPSRSLNVNVFCHQPARLDRAIDSAWIRICRPYFQRFGAEPPAAAGNLSKLPH